MNTYNLFGKDYTEQDLYSMLNGNDEWKFISRDMDVTSDFSKGSALFSYRLQNKKDPKKYIIVVVDCGILSSNDDCIGDIDEVYTEEEEYCSEVATYLITLSGESEGSCRRDLTYEQYKLIKGIFEDCESEYVSGTITKE